MSEHILQAYKNGARDERKGIRDQVEKWRDDAKIRRGQVFTTIRGDKYKVEAYNRVLNLLKENEAASEKHREEGKALESLHAKLVDLHAKIDSLEIMAGLVPGLVEALTPIERAYKVMHKQVDANTDSLMWWVYLPSSVIDNVKQTLAAAKAAMEEHDSASEGPLEIGSDGTEPGITDPAPPSGL